MKAFTVIMGLILIIMLAIGCGSHVTSTSTTSTTTTTQYTSQTTSISPSVNNVTIINFSFSPKEITIKPGDTVIWTNNDSVTHTVTGIGWGSNNLTLGQTYSKVFDTVGTFTYNCSIHTSMTGSVVVK